MSEADHSSTIDFGKLERQLAVQPLQEVLDSTYTGFAIARNRLFITSNGAMHSHVRNHNRAPYGREDQYDLGRLTAYLKNAQKGLVLTARATQLTRLEEPDMLRDTAQTTHSLASEYAAIRQEQETLDELDNLRRLFGENLYEIEEHDEEEQPYNFNEDTIPTSQSLVSHRIFLFTMRRLTQLYRTTFDHFPLATDQLAIGDRLQQKESYWPHATLEDQWFTLGSALAITDQLATGEHIELEQLLRYAHLMGAHTHLLTRVLKTSQA